MSLISGLWLLSSFWKRNPRHSAYQRVLVFTVPWDQLDSRFNWDHTNETARATVNAGPQAVQASVCISCIPYFATLRTQDALHEWRRLRFIIFAVLTAAKTLIVVLLGCKNVWTCWCIPKFRRNEMSLKMEAVCSSESLVSTYKSTRHYNPDMSPLLHTSWERFLCAQTQSETTFTQGKARVSAMPGTRGYIPGNYEFNSKLIALF
jgi:hypothetical protein